jgi:hypothetical protein
MMPQIQPALMRAHVVVVGCIALLEGLLAMMIAGMPGEQTAADEAEDAEDQDGGVPFGWSRRRRLRRRSHHLTGRGARCRCSQNCQSGGAGGHCGLGVHPGGVAIPRVAPASPEGS